MLPRQIFMFAGLLFLASHLFAEDRPTPYTYKVAGNERTRTSYIHALMDRCLAENKTLFKNAQELEEYLKQCLLNTKLFSSIAIKLRFDEIGVQVEERRSFLVVPYAQAASGERRKIGAILLETNFFGMGKIIGTGATLSDAGNSYFLFVRDPAIFQTKWNSELISIRAVDDVELIEGKEETDGFTETRNVTGVALGYAILDWTPKIKLWHYDREFRQLRNYATPEDVESVHGGVHLDFSNRAFKFYYSEGVKLALNYTRELTRSDDSTHLEYWESKFAYDTLLLWDHALKLQAVYTGTRGGRKVGVYRLGARPGFRGIKAKTAWAARFYSLSADYHIPVGKIAAGTVTTAPFADVGHVQTRGGKNSQRGHAAFGVGGYYYMKGINVPGLGLEFGYNNVYQGFFGNFTLGASI